jgi:hypothetical protein
VPDEDADDVGIDQPPDSGLALLQITIQPRILDRDSRFGDEQLEQRHASGRECAGSQAVLEIEDPNRSDLLEQRHAKHRSDVMLAQVVVIGKRPA